MAVTVAVLGISRNRTISPNESAVPISLSCLPPRAGAGPARCDQVEGLAEIPSRMITSPGSYVADRSTLARCSTVANGGGPKNGTRRSSATSRTRRGQPAVDGFQAGHGHHGDRDEQQADPRQRGPGPEGVDERWCNGGAEAGR